MVPAANPREAARRLDGWDAAVAGKAVWRKDAAASERVHHGHEQDPDPINAAPGQRRWRQRRCSLPAHWPKRLAALRSSGPPVKPYQPTGLWQQSAYGNAVGRRFDQQVHQTKYPPRSVCRCALSHHGRRSTVRRVGRISLPELAMERDCWPGMRFAQNEPETRLRNAQCDSRMQRCDRRAPMRPNSHKVSRGW